MPIKKRNYVGKIITFRKTIEELTEDESAEIFKLYKQVYESYENKSGRKYDKVNDLLKLYDEVIYFTINNIIFGGFISRRMNNKIYKISVILHYGDEYSKQYVYDILAQLLTNIGYMIEADGGVAHIIKNYYNIKPANRDIVENLFGKEKIAKWSEEKKTYDRKTENHVIKGKQLFGRICNKTLSKSWANKVKLSKSFINGCKLTINKIPYKDFDNLFTNVFISKAKLNFLSRKFTSYNDLDSESYLSNMVESHVIKINEVGNKKFKLSTNGFSFIDIYELDKKKVITSFFNKIKKKMKQDPQYILNDRESRALFRDKITKFFNSISKNKDVFGKLIDYDIAICIDAVPRDTSPKNKAALFKSINLIHTDIYPLGNMGDVLWSFRNKWYAKFNEKIKDIEEEDLNDIHNRNKWNNKIVGIFNIWISLTNGITDNGLTVLDFNKRKHGYLLPYKAFRPASRANDDNVNFISASLRYNKDQKWYTKFNMQFGECFIFNTVGTPHTGFKYVNGTGKSRRSVELRIVLLKNIQKKK